MCNSKEKVTNVINRSSNHRSLVLDGSSSSVSRNKLVLDLLVVSSPSLRPGQSSGLSSLVDHALALRAQDVQGL